MPATDLEPQARALIERIQAARRTAGLPEATLARSSDIDLAEVAGKLRKGELDPSRALLVALDDAIPAVPPGTQMRGWTMQADAVERMTLPADILKVEKVHLAVMVSAYHKPGMARAQLVAIVLWLDSGLRTAMR